jgi:catechol 2,3-dioxygenase-like lactoylglutathione lyase family enzyme
MQRHFDRTAEDIGNIVHLEHVNLTVPDQVMATRFYVTALGLTRDPYLNTGAEVMWINAGTTQFHLPHGPAQRLRGRVDLVIPGRQSLMSRLRAATPALSGAEFAFAEHPGFVDVVCPWGNRLRCFEPDTDRFGNIGLGIAQVVLDVPTGFAPSIARFYRDVFGARAEVSVDQDGTTAAHVRVGVGQKLVFAETSALPDTYDGHHIQIYVADFSGPHQHLSERGLVTEESNQHQFRFKDIVDPQTGAPCYQLEHEVRSMTNPLFRRPLVNRNPAQTTRNYRPGADQFAP